MANHPGSHKPGRPKTKIKKKGSKVLREFAAGTLRSSSGRKITSRNQALAIAFSEQRRAKKG